MTKISRGQRAHLLAKMTSLAYRQQPPWVHDPVSAAQARQANELLRALARMKGGATFVVMSGAASAYERMTMGMYRDVAMAVLGKVSP